MIVNVRYDGSEYELDIPEDNLADIIGPGEHEPVDIDKALQENKLPDRFLSGSFRILVVINDAYRSTPSAKILDRILPPLMEHNELKLIVATGLHREPTMDEYRSLIGENFEHLDKKFAWSNSQDYISFSKVGQWDDGGEVYIHSYFFWADDVIIIGSVEPHYFAGFTGGIKSIVPGLSYYKTIEHNHSKAISEKSQPAMTRGNPVWEELWSTLKLIDKQRIFSYQMVLNREREIAGLFSGGINESFEQAVELSRRIYIRQIKSRYDLVIAEHSPPLDRNLYQLQKCFENTKEAVKDGGTLLMLSACREGIGTSAFFELAKKYPNIDLLLQQEKPEFRLGIHKLYRTALLTKRLNLCLMSFLSDDAVRRVFLEPVEDAAEKIKEMLVNTPDLRILVVRDAGHTVLKHA